jgi:hypothetical protein
MGDVVDGFRNLIASRTSRPQRPARRAEFAQPGVSTPGPDRLSLPRSPAGPTPRRSSNPALWGTLPDAKISRGKSPPRDFLRWLRWMELWSRWGRAPRRDLPKKSRGGSSPPRDFSGRARRGDLPQREICEKSRGGSLPREIFPPGFPKHPPSCSLEPSSGLSGARSGATERSGQALPRQGERPELPAVLAVVGREV